MRSSSALISLLATAWTVAAATNTTDDGFIGLKTEEACKRHHSSQSKEVTVLLDKDEHPDALSVLQMVGRTADDDGDFVIHDNAAWTMIIMNATQNCIDALNGLAQVTTVEEATSVQSFVIEQQTGSPWGLQDISNNAGASGDPKAQTYTYSPGNSLGQGVDIYVVDTGVRVSHAVFAGRATEGFSFNGSALDGDGHGTHVAGSAGGSKFGVAQAANIIAVKVLGDDGSGSSSNTIAGMNWVINQHNKRKTEPNFVGSIMSMSWGLEGIATTVDAAITGAVDQGIHVSVAAGNEGTDACLSTPSHLGGANSSIVTVGSLNIQNKVSSFSNFGKCVDVFAPGEQILSAWSTGDNVINYLSGTSMATPHNSGVMATIIAQDPATYGQNPAKLKAAIIAMARQGQLTGNLGGAANLALSNGVNGNVKREAPVELSSSSGNGGSPAAWASDVVNVAKRWVVVSDNSPLRF